MPEEGCQIASKYDTSGGRVETHQRRSCPLYNKNWVQQASICMTAKSSSHNLSWQRWVQQPSICITAKSSSHNWSPTFKFRKQALAWLQKHPTIRHWPLSSASKHLCNCRISHNSSLTFEFSKQASKHLHDCRIIPQFVTDLVKVEKKHDDGANK